MGLLSALGGPNKLDDALRQFGPVIRMAFPDLFQGAAKARPRPAVRPPSQPQNAVQGELLTRAGQPQNFTGGRTPFIRTSPVPVRGGTDVIPSQIPGREAPGQLNIFGGRTAGAAPSPVPAFRTTQVQGPTSPAALELYSKDPGTYDSIKRLADQATGYYGKPVSVDDLIGPGGTDFLKRLELERVSPTSLVRSPGGAIKPPVPPGSSQLAARQAGELVPSPGGRISAPEEIIDVSVRELQNAAGGLRQVDLKKALLAAGIGSAAFGTGYLLNQEGDVKPAGIPGPMGPTSANPEMGLVNDPAVSSPQRGLGGEQMAPVYRGADGQTVIVTPGDQDESLRAMKQQYVSKAGTPARQLEDYYRQREVYAKVPAVNVKVIGELTSRGELNTPELKAWAAANPTLAYELLRKKYGVSDVMNQQMPQVKQYELGSALGTNNANNAVGNAQSTAEAALGQQGAYDVASAAAPMMYEKLEAFRFNPAAAEALGSVNAYRPEGSQIDADAYARLAEFYKKQPSQYGASSTGF